MARETIQERAARLAPAGAWLREQRQERDWTQADFAGRLNITQPRLSAYETGQIEVDPSVVGLIADAFELPDLDVWRALRLRLPRGV